MREYDTIIGLEVHTVLDTQTKAFCGCRNEFGANPNTHVCPVCLGLPGALPMINKRAVEMTIMGGLAFGSKINKEAIFERKNYFYPDLSKGYQITQFKDPIAIRGGITLDSGKYIRINRVHLEEDAGKLIHHDDTGESFVDFNRSGVPLLEIVSEPDLRSAEEAIEFIDKLKNTLVFNGISHCRMEKAELRFDVNISVSPKDLDTLGTRVELKNLGSLKTVSKAIEYEVNRQKTILEYDGKVSQETRGWDDKGGRTYSMRRKETEDDYRYFPDPDVIKISITDADIKSLKRSLPETIELKKLRYEGMGLDQYHISVLTTNKEVADYFDAVVELTHSPEESSNWVMTEVFRVFNESSSGDIFSLVTPENLAAIINLIISGEISRFSGKILFDEVLTTGKSVDALLKEISVQGVIEDKEIIDIIDSIIKEKPNIIDDYKRSPEDVAHYFVGRIMKLTNGKADIDVILPLIDNRLDK